MLDIDYKAWIATLPCIVCVRGVIEMLQIAPFTWIARSEAAHVGDRGLGQKSSDRETIPLCMQHHRTGKDAAHVIGKRFWIHHGLDRVKLIAEFNREYEEQR